MTATRAPRASMFDRPAGTLALAGVNGLLWGVVVSILIGAGLALVTGLALRPQLLPPGGDLGGGAPPRGLEAIRGALLLLRGVLLLLLQRLEPVRRSVR